ncbi:MULTISPECIES: phosphotransferase family protein [unclassified Microbacterium]|uniref:phosphotransferase family protein n=1 Tax=unclassified Microbacterium TaxID=2609290 RepID=UPI000EA9E29E|nr:MULTISPECIES: phosphotransferase [unclassified Microbacterium]MBT2483816.1 phosphotransferase [Microbacterium sp. ISL-108]RKN66800.1 hypothetical protein D7252_03790 [Microbacterium sp. CGR2]
MPADRILQGAVGQVRLVERDGRTLLEKRMPDARRHDTEVRALQALQGSGLPVPELVSVEPGAILMTLLPGERLDAGSAGERLARLRASAPVLRRLHELPPPPGLAPAPDDELIVRRYRAAGGPPVPLTIPPSQSPAFCHGDWTDGNVLAVGREITGFIDWEAAHVGDPLRELSRAAWGASRKDPRSFDALVDAYGADREAGPPEYLEELTADLEGWTQG